MFDKYGFYFTKEVGFEKYSLDIGLTKNLVIPNNEYVIFHKKNFIKKNTGNLQKGMALVTQSKRIDFTFDRNFFIYGLVYYQRKPFQAYIKSTTLDTFEMFYKLFKDFGLELKLRDFIQIHGNYPSLEEITNLSFYADLNQAISFILALSLLNGNWNIAKQDNTYLNNILIKFPFDGAVNEYKQLIFNIEDILIKNKIYNKLYLTKKQEFVLNIVDFDLLEVIGKAIVAIKELKNFLQIDDKISPVYSKSLENLRKQLNTDLRINLERFKLTEVENINLEF